MHRSTEKYKKIQEENEAKNINSSNKYEVETLQMIITSAKITEIKDNKAGKVKQSKKFQFTAKFNDSRYLNYKDEIKIITTTDVAFRDIHHAQAHQYYFIADGVLHKSNDKYIKFEITNLIKVSRVEKPQGDLFE